MRYLTIIALALSLGACKASASGTISANPDTDAGPKTDPEDVRIVGDHLEIDQKIQFLLDSDEILPDSFETLDHLALLLSHHEEFTKLHIVGHTDESGDDDHNQDLSERRAAAVKAALEQRGVSQPMEARGEGSKQPLCTEDSDECHEQNRRVEFIVESEDLERAETLVD